MRARRPNLGHNPGFHRATENAFYRAFQSVFDSVFGDHRPDEAIWDPALYPELYVTTRTSLSINQSDPGHELSAVRRPEDLSLRDPQRVGGAECDVLSVMLNDHWNLPVFLIGHVGVGKTELITYLRKCIIPNEPMFGSVVPIYVDLSALDRHDSLDSARNIIWNATSIATSDLAMLAVDTPFMKWLEVRHRFWSDRRSILRGIRTGPESEWDRALAPHLSEFLNSAGDEVNALKLRFLKEEGQKRPVLIIDNIDHIDLGVVKDLMELVVKIRSAGKVGILVSIRPPTHRRLGSIAANTAQWGVIGVNTPTAAEVINRRLRLFAKHWGPSLEGKVVRLGEGDAGLVSSKDFGVYIEGLIDAMGSKGMHDTLAQAANYDMRTLLAGLCALLVSHLLDVSKVSTRLFRHRMLKEELSFAEFINRGYLARALALNLSNVYFGRRSLLPNLLNIGVSHLAGGQFIGHRMLWIISRDGRPMPRENLPAVCASFMEANHVEESLHALWDLGLVFSGDSSELCEKVKTVEATSRARLLIGAGPGDIKKALGNYLPFLAVVVDDIPIPEDVESGKVLVTSWDPKATDLKTRIEWVVLMLEALAHAEDEDFRRIAGRGAWRAFRATFDDPSVVEHIERGVTNSIDRLSVKHPQLLEYSSVRARLRDVVRHLADVRATLDKASGVAAGSSTTDGGPR